jgi:hypothetical protein
MNLNKIFSLNILNLKTKFDYIYSLEIMWVLKWFKKIAKLEPFSLENLDKIKEILEKLGLKYIYLEKDEYFDEKEMLFKKWKIHWKSYIDLYVSKSEKFLEIITNNDFNIKEKNFLIWKMLGYPECCIKSFLDFEYKWDISFNQIIKNKTVWKFDRRLNNLINPYSLIPFFPCSYNCEKAIEYAENNLEIVWNIEEIEHLFKNNIIYKDFWNYEIITTDIEWKEDNIFYFNK